MIPTSQLNLLKVCTATHSGTFEIKPVFMTYWALVSTVKRQSALVAKVLVTRDFLRETSPGSKHFWIFPSRIKKKFYGVKTLHSVPWMLVDA